MATEAGLTSQSLGGFKVAPRAGRTGAIGPTLMQLPKGNGRKPVQMQSGDNII